MSMIDGWRVDRADEVQRLNFVPVRPRHPEQRRMTSGVVAMPMRVEHLRQRLAESITSLGEAIILAGDGRDGTIR